MPKQYDLTEVQARLDAMGVRDVKLTFSPDAFMRSAEEVKQGVANALGSYLDGERRPLQPREVAQLLGEDVPMPA